MGVKCLAQEHNNESPLPGLEPGLLYLNLLKPKNYNTLCKTFFCISGEAPPCLPQEVKNCVWPAMGKFKALDGISLKMNF